MRPSFFTPPSRPAQIILDTDIATDCDDAGALAVLHALASAGEAEILAVLVNNKDTASVGAVAAINAFYCRPSIPLGAYQGEVIGTPAGDFVQALAADTARYGHSIIGRDQVPSATAVYRRTLAAAPDGRAIIVSIGHLNNLHDLLASTADDHYPLGGLELVRKKVAHVVMMGGDYPTGREYNFFAHGSDAVTASVLERWPTPVLFSGFTFGAAILTGPALTTLPPEHPVRRAYAMYPSKPLINGRPSWDQTAVLAAVRGPAPLWKLSEPGRNLVSIDGSNHWTADPVSPHAYLLHDLPPEIARAEIESLMCRSSAVSAPVCSSL